jgi:adenosylcobinamide kinase/adenosylcobinamide-phosphate guanylyltransferase
MGAITLVTGPVRSGKSRWAVNRAVEFGRDVVFWATYRQDPSDLAMAERLRLHRAERPATWRTLEAPRDPIAIINSLFPQPSIVLMDCLTLWLGDRINLSDQAIMESWEQYMLAFVRAEWPIILVGSEVGWSPVSIDPMLRRFCDLSGSINQRVAKDASDVWLCVSGCSIKLK